MEALAQLAALAADPPSEVEADAVCISSGDESNGDPNVRRAGLVAPADGEGQSLPTRPSEPLPPEARSR